MLWIIYVLLRHLKYLYFLIFRYNQPNAINVVNQYAFGWNVHDKEQKGWQSLKQDCENWLFELLGKIASGSFCK